MYDPPQNQDSTGAYACEGPNPALCNTKIYFKVAHGPEAAQMRTRRPPSGSKWRPAYFFKPPRDADSNPNSLNFAFLRKAATRSIRCLAGEFGRDVRVNQISPHRLISRQVSLSRSKFRFRPRSGAKNSTISLAGGGCAAGSWNSLFEQAGGIGPDRAAVGSGLASERGLNLGGDVNGDRSMGAPFKAMLQPWPDPTPPHPWRQGHAPHSASNPLKINRSSQQWHRSAATRMLSSS